MELPKTFRLHRKTLLINAMFLVAVSATLIAICLEDVVLALIFGPFALLFIWVTVGVLRKLNDQSSQLVVTEEGFLTKQFPFGFLPWQDISRIDVVVINRQSYLCFHLFDSAKYLHHYGLFTKYTAKFSRLLDVPETSIAIGLMDIEMEHIEEMKQRLVERKKVQQGVQGPTSPPPAGPRP